MKKLIALLLLCALMLSCTACSLNHGNDTWREKELLDYVSKYYGKAEVLDAQKQILNTTTLFTLKDEQDGFEYTMTAMEVYLSDLGFAKNQGDDTYDETDEKTIVFDGQFVTQYTAHLVANKVDKMKLAELFEKYSDSMLSISSFTYHETTMEIFSTETTQTAFMMSQYDADVVREFVEVLKEADDRDILPYYIMPIYEAEEVDGDAVLKTDAEGNVRILGYYDFYFDYIFEAAEYDGIIMLHDYLQNQDIKDVKIISTDTTKKLMEMPMPEGFTFISKDNEEAGVQVIFELDGKQYVFYTSMGAKIYETEKNEFGIHEGSFLDVIAIDRSGGAPVLISWYATMYPNDYASLAVYLVEYNATPDNDTEEVPAE